MWVLCVPCVGFVCTRCGFCVYNVHVMLKTSTKFRRVFCSHVHTVP